MCKTFILLTQKVKKLAGKHLPVYLRHPVASCRIVLWLGICVKQGIAETAKTNGPTCDNMCIQKI